MVVRRRAGSFPAFDLPNKVDAKIAKQRRDRLMKQQAKISKQLNKGNIGNTYKVIFEGLSQESDLLFQGRLEGQTQEIDGHILINSNMEANVPMIRASVESLGLKFSDIKVLLISHAHFDHCAGSAMIKQLTGAKYMVMDGDVDVVQSGGKSDFQYGSDPASLYPPASVDRVLHDGDEVKL